MDLGDTVASEVSRFGFRTGREVAKCPVGISKARGRIDIGIRRPLVAFPLSRWPVGEAGV